MLRFDGIVFGPIRSRRLGSSLGINLLPREGKLCNFDCVYCECGWNADGRTDMTLPSVEEAVAALEAKIKAVAAEGVHVDSITFSGHGEPTLHPGFAAVVDALIPLRDKYLPDAKVSVLSNATTLVDPQVRQALRKVDNPILKLDAPFDAMVQAVNKPNAGYSVEAVVKAMESFEGEFVLQTMFLHGAGVDYSADARALAAWKDIVRRTRPRQIQVYSLDRPSPMKGLSRMDSALMESLVQDLVNEGFDVMITK